jgi:D-serine deaminase-like pyridoxal phosphate-dependent protein
MLQEIEQYPVTKIHAKVATSAPYPEIDTPAVLVDLDKLEANIKEMTQVAQEAGIKLRPHVKVHESSEIAKMQIEAGACGVEVGPVGQAEALAENGIDDIIIAHPGYYGRTKFETLKRLLRRQGLKLQIVFDMYEQAASISRAGEEVGKKIPIIMKIDTNTKATGLARYGQLPIESALVLAREISDLAGVELIGLYSHEIGGIEGPEKMALRTAEQVTETARILKAKGFNIEHVSTGASPEFRHTCKLIKEGRFSEITEVHPGTCVFGDMSYLSMGGTKSLETCAASVLVTVMSTSHRDWCVIDTGYKTFGSLEVGDSEKWNGMVSRGVIKGRSDLFIGFLCAETTMVYYREPYLSDSNKKLEIGEQLEVIPNSMITVSNTKDVLYGVRNGKVEKIFKVNARGRGV